MKKKIVQLCLKLTISAIIALSFFSIINPMLPQHHLTGSSDERFYTGRAMQDIQFLIGERQLQNVYFTQGINHPFTGELIMGLSLVVHHQTFAPPEDVWTTNLTNGQLLAGRQGTLFTASLGVGALVFLALEIFPLLVIPGVLFLLSSPGFVDYSMTTELDIYTAVFTSMTLIFLYFYTVRGKKWGLFLSAVCLGLSFGSKIEWDPIIVSVALLLAILASKIEANLFVKLKAIAVSAVFAVSTFIITSPVTALRIGDVLNSTVGSVSSGKNIIGKLSFHTIQLSNIFVTQPLVSTSNYSVFLEQIPVNVVVFACVLLGTLVIGISGLARKSHLNDPLLVYLLIVGFFVSTDFLLTGITFEFARNYIRDSVYEGLLLTLFLGYLYKKNKKIGLVSVVIASVILAYSLDRYVGFLPSFLAKTGYATPQIGLGILSFGLSPKLFGGIIGWSLLSISLASIFVLGAISLWFGRESDKELLSKTHELVNRVTKDWISLD